MYFNIDKQTLDDLNIFGKRGEDSIFSLFNRTYSSGGSELMEQLFLYPKSGKEIIQERNKIIQFFSNKEREFPIPAQILEVIADYIAERDIRSQLTLKKKEIKQRFSSLIGTDNHFKSIQKGIQAISTCFLYLKNFLISLDLSLVECDFFKLSQEILSLLEENDLSRICLTINNQKLSYEEVVRFDLFFRFNRYVVVEKILNYIYQLDLYIAISSVANEHRFSFPSLCLSDEQIMEIEEFYHPLIKGAKGNNLKLKQSVHTLFLTGANMAGKSTFMKSLGITIYLAHLGLPVPAKAMKFSLQDGLLTTINLADNLEMGHSHFYAEVIRVKKVSMELAHGKKLVVIFDELFRGTNVKDAHEATIAITKAYSYCKNCFFLVSTHIIEAADDLIKQGVPIQYAYMPTKMNGKEPIYSYQLTSGVTSDRHGMLIIENEGILDLLANGKKGENGSE